MGQLFRRLTAVFVGAHQQGLVVGLQLSTVRHYQWRGLHIGCERATLADNGVGREDLVDVRGEDHLDEWLGRVARELPTLADEFQRTAGAALLERTREVRERASAAMAALSNSESPVQASEGLDLGQAESARVDAILERSFLAGLVFHPSVEPSARLAVGALVKTEPEAMARLVTMREPLGVNLERPSDEVASQLLPSVTDLVLRRWPKAWRDPIPDGVGVD